MSGLKESVSSWTAGDDVAELGDEERGGASSVGPHPPVGPSTSGVVKGPMIGPSLPVSLTKHAFHQRKAPVAHMMKEGVITIVFSGFQCCHGDTV